MLALVRCGDSYWKLKLLSEILVARGDMMVRLGGVVAHQRCGWLICWRGGGSNGDVVAYQRCVGSCRL